MIFLSDKRRWFVAALLLGSSPAWAEQEAFFPVFGYNPAAAGVVNFDQVAVGATDPQAITVTYAEAGKGSTTRDLGIVGTPDCTIAGAGAASFSFLGLANAASTPVDLITVDNTVTVGATVGFINLQCTAGASLATATLTCTEHVVIGQTDVPTAQTWTLNCPAGTAAATPDLTVDKVLNPAGNFVRGETGRTYQITVTNAGDGPTTAATTVTDTLPTGLTATGIAGTGWSCTQPSGPCNRADALGASLSYPVLTLTVNVAADAPTPLINNVAVSGGGETNTANDTDSVSTPVSFPDLTVDKVLNGGNFVKGETGRTYTITVTNAGNAPTTGTTTVTDTLPTGLTATAISGTGWSNCTATPVVGNGALTVSCDSTDAIAAAGTFPALTLTVSVDAAAPASVTNNVTVSGGGQTNTANDTDSVVTTVDNAAAPDLTVDKVLNGGNFVKGETGRTYTITVTNSGNATTTGTTTVTDTLPTGLTATAISGTGWSNCTATPVVGNGVLTVSCDSTDAIAAAGTFPALTLTVSVDAAAPASVTNNVTVSGGGQTNTANDTDSVVTTVDAVAAPDLTVDKVLNGGNFVKGETGRTYTITVTNSGNATTTGTTTVTDTLPTGLTATAISGTGWSNCTATPVVGNGVLTVSCDSTDAIAAAGTFPALTLTVSVDAAAPASVTNNVTVSGGGQTNTANDTDSVVTTVDNAAAPDLTVDKVLNGGNFVKGETGRTYTITVTNSGNAVTTGTTTVTDTLPTGLTATAISGTGWSNCTATPVVGNGVLTVSCDSTDAIAAAGTFPALTLTVSVDAAAPASVTNNVTVSGGGQTNTANDTDSVVTTVDAAAAPDLTIVKAHVGGNFIQGEVGRAFTITVTNSGSAPTSGAVIVTDTLPGGLTATSIAGTGWSCTQPSGPCNRADALGASLSYPVLTLTVNVGAAATSPQNNVATVSGGSETNVANDSDNDSVVVDPAGDVPPTVTFNPSPGGTVTFSGGFGSILITPSGGAGVGVNATTTAGSCALGGANPGAFSITSNLPLSFVGSTTTSLQLQLSCLTAGATASLTCQRTLGTAPPVVVTWQLTCSLAAAPILPIPALDLPTKVALMLLVLGLGLVATRSGQARLPRR